MRIVDFLESTWIILFLISIIFIFIIVIRELGEQTRNEKNWQRIPYQKMLPRVSLTFQHYSRKGELLTNTSNNICKSIRRDLLDYFKIKRGYSNEEMKALFSDFKKVEEIFPQENLALFLYDPELWLKSFIPQKPFFSSLFEPIVNFFREKDPAEDLFYIELALIVNNAQKIIESG